MTKAEMIARIASQTGVEKTAALAVVEAFMENVKESMIAGEDVPERLRQLHYQAKSRKSGPQHHEEHDDCYSGPFHPRFQAGQSILKRSKRGE